MAENTYVGTFGTKLYYGTAGGSATTEVTDIKGFPDFPGLVADKFDISRVGQANAIKRFAAAMSDPGMLKIAIALIKAEVATIYGLHTTLKAWKITFFDGSTLTWDGWIQRIQPKGNNGDEINFEIDIQVSGPVTFTAAA